MNKEYIGDSVYADFDGYHIVLMTENGFGPSNITTASGCEICMSSRIG